jgi:xanthine dehydrogenase accessory factor
MLADAESVLDLASLWCSQGQRVVAATVVATWSSSPRPLGSQMIIAEDGRFAGSVSGGCVEAAVIQAAAEVLLAGAARCLKFGVTSEQAWEVGLPCGGQIEVFLVEYAPALVQKLCRARAARESATCLMDLDRGLSQLWPTPDIGDAVALIPGLAEGITRAVAEDRSRLLEEGGRRVFAQVLSAPLRLFVVGAVHLTQVLADLGSMNGFEVVVIDPRTAFATKERFPHAQLVHEWPDVALDSLGPDRRTAVVVLSHDSKLDEPALASALRSRAFYIGALGSQRTQQARRRRLAEQGFSEWGWTSGL